MATMAPSVRSTAQGIGNRLISVALPTFLVIPGVRLDAEEQGNDENRRR